jgi:membrane-associated phospholipid phosphatase
MVFALIISRIFEPLVLFCFLLCFILLRAGITGLEWIWYLSIILGVIIIPPIVLLLRAIHEKQISNWDISNRKERVRALFIFLLFLLCGVIGISFVGNALVTNFFLLIAIMYILFFLITLWFKISGHMSTATFVFGTLIYWFGGYTWFFVLAIPFLAWSRVFLKRHTTLQVITGTLFGASMVFLGIYLYLL